MKKNLIYFTLATSFITGISAKEKGNDHEKRGAKNSHVEEIKSMQEYEDLVTRSVSPVVIDFFAEWCEPCKKLAPVVEELAKEYAGRVRFVKIDTGNDAIDPLLEQFNIRSIPTFIFKKGQSVSQKTPTNKPLTKADLRATIEKLLI